MAGTETKRIIELTEASTVQSGDFIAVDSNARGTKKVSTDMLATSAALTAETNARTGADEQMSERMDGIEEQTALIQNPTKTLSGALVSFTDGADMPMVACSAEIVPKQSGSGTPSPSNVRQISGWESVNVNVTGKNLFDTTITTPRIAANGITFTLNDDGTVTANGTATGTAQLYWIDIPSATYADIWSGKVLNGCPSISGCSLRIEKETSPWTNYATDTGNGVTIGTIPNNVGDLAVYCRVAQGTTLNNAVFKPMIRVSGASADYEPYNGHTTTTSLGRTVYGGEAEIVGGSLTDKMAMVTINGSSNITQRRAGTNNSLFGIDLGSGQGGKAVAETSLPNVIANELPLETAYNAWRNETPLVAMTSTGNTIWFRLPSITALADARTYLASNPLQVCYELATPQTYTLTPTQIKTLLGENNVWADSGDVEITYRRDISIVLENLENALSGSNSLNSMMMSAPTENTAEEPTEDEAEDDMR